MEKVQAIWHALDRLGYKTENDLLEVLEFFRKKAWGKDYINIFPTFFLFEGHLFIEVVVHLFIDDFSSKNLLMGIYRLSQKGEDPVELLPEEKDRLEKYNNLFPVSLDKVLEYLKLPIVK